ncbi:MAG: hypothetical protein M1818_005002 [Claussenomyces sp. TS43310]|nr:MAG: hypothetical protein M1818_005002 [Claussenomyces sp. TS43310]
MATLSTTHLLTQFSHQHPTIKVVIPAEEGDNAEGSAATAFRELTEATYFAPASHPAAAANPPLGFAQPRSAAEVRQIVAWAAAVNAGQAAGARMPLSVRVGGHEPWKRSTPRGALVLDLRGLREVEIEGSSAGHEGGTGGDGVLPPPAVAKVGGGVLTGDLVARLAELGYATPTAASTSVGYVGWATLGGYSGMASVMGMGVDQIVGATVVTADGGMVQVNEDDEMMFGIRGGGGNVGVIVELRIRVYAVQKYLAGNIVYDSSNMSQTIKNFFTGYTALIEQEGMPAGFSGQLVFAKIPKLGRSLVFTFLWLSHDQSGAAAQIARLKSLPGLHAVADTIAEHKPHEWIAMSSKMVAVGVHGGTKAVNVPSLADDTLIDVIARSMTTMPDLPETALTIQQYWPTASEKAVRQSCFAPRRAHFMILAIGASLDPTRGDEARDWAFELCAQLRSRGVALKGGYVAQTMPGDVPIEECFDGEDWKRLTVLKRKYDRNGAWQYAVPQMGRL